MSNRSEMMRLVKRIRKQGLNVERTGSGHWKVTRPGGGDCVIMGFSPNHSGMHKTMKRLEELGFDPKEK